MPDPESHRRAKELFLAVADLDAAERGRRLDASCGGDGALRAAVERMIAADAAPSHLLDASAAAKAAGGTAAAPDRVGPYRLIRLLGEGGSGAVYEAEQSDPPRRVALKVLHPWLLGIGRLGGLAAGARAADGDALSGSAASGEGLAPSPDEVGWLAEGSSARASHAESATPDVAQRFRREARLLARLDHAGIARVFAAGIDDSRAGPRPYLAMELVRGHPITRHAALHRLDVPQRLALFAEVCDAVDHAHQRGVIHRDLKPSNVLVDDAGRPRVVDFGIARAIDGGIDRSTVTTASHAILGTIRYMSPEQAAGRSNEVDARSDVYSLGVLAYELLTGSPPLDLDTTSLVDALRRVAEDDPTPAGDHDPNLRGDVETILGKMLEKDPARRYASAAEIAADVRHHVAREPIVARRPGAGQHVVRFARRHKVLTVALVATMASLAVGLAASLHFAFRAIERREIAERQAYRAHVLLAANARDDGLVSTWRLELNAAPEELRNFEWRWLDAGFDTSLAATPAGPPGIGAVVATRDGATLLRHFDGSLTSWRIDEEHLDETPAAVAPQVPGRVLGLSPTGEFVIWQGSDHILHVERRSDGGERSAVAIIPDAGVAASAAAFAPSTGRLAARLVNSIVLWSTSDGRRLADQPLAPAVVSSPVFDAAGERLAFVDSGRGVTVVDALTGRGVGAFRNDSAVRAIAFSPDGSSIASTSDAATNSRDNVIVVRDGASLEVKQVLRGHVGLTRDIVFASDGRSLASANTDCTVRLWDLASGEGRVVGRRRPGAFESLCFVDGGNSIVAGCRDGSARLYSTTDPTEANVLRGHESYVYPVAFQPGGRLLASGSWDRTIRLWDVRSGTEAMVLTEPTGSVLALAFSPDGARLLGASSDHACRLFDVQSGREVGRLALPGSPGGISLAWSGDGGTIAIGLDDMDAAAWLVDGRSFAPLRSLGAANAGTRAVAFGPDSNYLACGDKKGRVHCYDVSSEHLVWQVDLDCGQIESLAWSHSGDRLAVAGTRGDVLLLDTTTRVTIARLGGHGGSAFSAAFSPDGSRVVTGGRDGIVRLWDPTIEGVTAELRGHEDYVFSVAFSPDGRCVASGSGDGTLRLWDTDPPGKRLRARRCRNP